MVKRNYKKNDDDTDAISSKKHIIVKRLEDVAYVLEHKKGVPGSRERERLLRDANKISVCEVRKKKRKFGAKEPWYHRTYKHAFCPRCQLRRSDLNYRALVGQFTGCDPGRLYIITLNPGPGNVSGRELPDAMKKMKDAFDRLCRSPVWKAVVRRCGGPQHRPWIPASDSHDAGFRVHHQLIALVRNKRPRWKAIAKLYRRILGLPKGAPSKSYFFVEPLDTLEGHARYLCKSEQLIPGVNFDKPREKWEMMNIPDEDMVAFVNAVRYRQRVYFRGVDRSRKPPKPTRRMRDRDQEQS